LETQHIGAMMSGGAQANRASAAINPRIKGPQTQTGKSNNVRNWATAVLSLLFGMFALAFLVFALNAETGAIIFVSLWIVGIALFVAPSVIGFPRDVQSKWLLFFANLVLGATGVVWIACLAYACFGPKMISDSYYEPIDGDR
jgi:NADH:ubiquinone oxidoreductase subunit 6 (subunit J)